MKLLAIDVGIRNMAICLLQVDDRYVHLDLDHSASTPTVTLTDLQQIIGDYVEILHWDLVSLVEGIEHLKFNRTTDRDLTYTTFCVNLRTELDRMFTTSDHFADIDHILIEDQAKFQEMGKVIQAYLHAYFTWFRPSNDLRIVLSTKKVAFVRSLLHKTVPRRRTATPAAAAAAAAATSQPTDEPTQPKRNHSINKRDSRDLVLQLITNNQTSLVLYQQHRKKDDLADAFLHIVRFLRPI